MKILIDASTVRGGGGTTYLRYVLPVLQAQSPADQIYLLLSSRYQLDLVDSLPDGVHPLPCELDILPWIRYFQLRYRIPRLIDELGIDLLFSVSELTVIPGNCPSVVLVRNPKLFLSGDHLLSSLDRLTLMRRRLASHVVVHRSLRRASRIAVVSRWFQEYVIRKTGIDPQKTAVVYHGCADRFRPLESARQGAVESPDPYILIVSNVTFHKNLLTAVQGMAAFLKKEPTSQLKMRIAGPVTERRLFKKLTAEGVRSGIEDRIEFLGEVSHSELVRLYCRAKIFLFPSLMESFGHPLLEALSCGVPSIVSDLPVFHEIAGDDVEYFPPSRTDVLAEKIALLMEDQELRQSRSQAGVRRSAEFCWEKTATRLHRLFEEAASSVPAPKPGARRVEGRVPLSERLSEK